MFIEIFLKHLIAGDCGVTGRPRMPVAVARYARTLGHRPPTARRHGSGPSANLNAMAGMFVQIHYHVFLILFSASTRLLLCSVFSLGNALRGLKLAKWRTGNVKGTRRAKWRCRWRQCDGWAGPGCR